MPGLVSSFPISFLPSRPYSFPSHHWTFPSVYSAHLANSLVILCRRASLVRPSLAKEDSRRICLSCRTWLTADRRVNRGIFDHNIIPVELHNEFGLFEKATSHISETNLGREYIGYTRRVLGISMWICKICSSVNITIHDDDFAEFTSIHDNPPLSIDFHISMALAEMVARIRFTRCEAEWG